ncbi:unnamed protein product [Vitrella brassicaformis CCMP3155]|uniref:Uncharacterized protein n=1 Tax=Vitrella brassicaformis (strain CCMP3155) TaxID=1169540 RepID=A0A0G4F012_VITBC|nr:unnamed protein product [Vitrella brassicaformis CCMP3155]|mmetsp:Transcript_22365/g.55109  ORF Transcript_22365/g.55109 Transcript_22365/m.55109 type:complete len:222 (-) Transcript_22365:515-1180(-)|eukprot:CEM04543.1 unnamed protein product [Vitrella brassicaformis CCMP3155]
MREEVRVSLADMPDFLPILLPDKELKTRSIVPGLSTLFALLRCSLEPMMRYEIKPSYLGTSPVVMKLSFANELPTHLRTSPPTFDYSIAVDHLDTEDKIAFSTDADVAVMWEGQRVPTWPMDAYAHHEGLCGGDAYVLKVEGRVRGVPAHPRLMEEPVPFNIVVSSLPCGVPRVCFELIPWLAASLAMAAWLTYGVVWCKWIDRLYAWTLTDETDGKDKDE